MNAHNPTFLQESDTPSSSSSSHLSHSHFPNEHEPNFDFSHLKRPQFDLNSLKYNSLKFMLLDLVPEACEFDSNNQGEASIRLFGLTENGNTVSLEVTGFLSSMLIHYPSNVPEPSSLLLDQIRENMIKELREDGHEVPENALVQLEFIQREMLGFMNDSHDNKSRSYIKIYFSHPRHMLNFQKKFNTTRNQKASNEVSPTIKGERWENLFTVQFILENNLRVLSWIEVKPEHLELEVLPLPKYQIQGKVNFQNLLPFSIAYTDGPKYPPFRVLSLQNKFRGLLEEHQEGFNETPSILTISCAFEVLTRDLASKQVVFTLDQDYERSEGYHVLKFRNEGSMVSAWMDFVRTFDPDFIIGGDQFDTDLGSIFKNLSKEDLEDFGRFSDASFHRRVLISLYGFQETTNTPLFELRDIILRYDLNETMIAPKKILNFLRKDQETREKRSLSEYSIEMLCLKYFKKLKLVEVLRKKAKDIAIPLRYALRNPEIANNKEGHSQTIVSLPVKQKLGEIFGERASGFLILKGSLSKYDKNEDVVENVEAYHDVNLWDENDTYLMKGIIDSFMYSSLKDALRKKDNILIRDFEVQIGQGGEAVMRINQATRLDIKEEGIKILALLEKAIKVADLVLLIKDNNNNKSEKKEMVKILEKSKSIFNLPFPFEQEKKEKVKPQNLNQNQKSSASKIKRSATATSTTSNSKSKTIYDYFKVSTVKRSLSAEKNSKKPSPITIKEGEPSLLNKRSFGEIDKTIGQEKVEPKLQKMVKLEQKNSSNNRTDSIRKLSVYVQEWELKIRVFGKSTRFHKLTGGVYNEMFVVEVIDEASNDISMVFSDPDAIRAYYQNIQVGKVYLVSGGTIIQRTVQAYKSKNSLQVYFFPGSPIRFEEQEDTGFLPKLSYKFLPISELKDPFSSGDNNGEVSVIGMVVQTKQEQIVKKDQTAVTTKRVWIADHSNELIELVLWDKQGEIRMNLFDVVSISRAKVKAFNGIKSLSLSKHSHVMRNYFPDFNNGSGFYGWVQEFYRDKFGNLFKLPLPINRNNQTKPIQDVFKFQDDPSTFEVRAYINSATKRITSYKACPHCKRSVSSLRAITQEGFPIPNQENEGGGSGEFGRKVQVYDVAKDLQSQKTGKNAKTGGVSGPADNRDICGYCAKPIIEAKEVPIANIKLTDYSETIEASAFGDIVNTINHSNVGEADIQEYKLKIRPSLDAQGERKFSVLGVRAVDFVEDSLDILQQLERYKHRM